MTLLKMENAGKMRTTRSGVQKGLEKCLGVRVRDASVKNGQSGFQERAQRTQCGAKKNARDWKARQQKNV